MNQAAKYTRENMPVSEYTAVPSWPGYKIALLFGVKRACSMISPEPVIVSGRNSMVGDEWDSVNVKERLNDSSNGSMLARCNTTPQSVPYMTDGKS